MESRTRIRYNMISCQKVVETVMYHLRKQIFYAVFYTTNAPGRSSFSCIERIMASLSRES